MRRRGVTATAVPLRPNYDGSMCTRIFFPSLSGTSEKEIVVCNPRAFVKDVLEEKCKIQSLSLDCFTVTDSRGIVIPLDSMLEDIEDHKIVLHVSDTNLAEVLCTACWRGDLDEVKEMLKKPEYLHVINGHNKKGQTPLFCATRKGHLEIVILLLEHDADVDLTVIENGSTPLHAACFGGHKEVIAALLIAGANPHKRNSIGLSSIKEATGEACSVFMLAENPFGAIEKLQSLHPVLIQIKPKKLMTHTEAQKAEMRSKQKMRMAQNDLERLCTALLSYYDACRLKFISESKKNIFSSPRHVYLESSTRGTSRSAIFPQIVGINQLMMDELSLFETFFDLMKAAPFFQGNTKTDCFRFHLTFFPHATPVEFY
eukprot:TRINITY_DN5131_c1_g1_i1.p1 TRINITY_DN5131_c1_g1~~TRINITY_DN5131_c1_g1_i1.p1  ORF type:complete len:391 (+),score=63.65 TRINITY_DN5131_c1_g1_i1:60-1175(+)